MPPRFIPPDPEEEAQRQWAIDHPWERATFAVPPPRDFQREDWANTYESAKALEKNNQVRQYFDVPSAGVDPQSGEATTALGSRLVNQFTPEEIDQKTWGAFQKRWGVAPETNWHTYKTPGGGVVGVDPHTGKSAQLVPDAIKPPVIPKMAKDAIFDIPTGFVNDKPSGHQKLTKTQLLDAWKNLSSDVKKSEAVKLALGGDYPREPDTIRDNLITPWAQAATRNRIDGSASGVLNSAPSFVPPTIKTNSPYRDGVRLQGPGGKFFVVRHGVPVPE